MKKSTKLTLTIMAATSGLSLSACSDNTQEAKQYSSLEECKSGSDFTDEQCEESYQAAQKLHEQNSPRYASRGLCEGEFVVGQCEQRVNNNGQSFWSPFLAGYLVSNIISDRGSYRYASPYYAGSGGRQYTWNGGVINTTRDANGRLIRTIDKKTIKNNVRQKPAKIMTKTSVVSRGGFGSRSRSRSGGRSYGG